MSRKGLKRLDLWLPEDHPIFGYPAGQRSRTAREWLDLGARLAGIEERLAELERRLGGGGRPPEGRPQPSGFDVTAFARSLTDAFG